MDWRRSGRGWAHELRSRTSKPALLATGLAWALAVPDRAAGANSPQTGQLRPSLRSPESTPQARDTPANSVPAAKPSQDRHAGNSGRQTTKVGLWPIETSTDVPAYFTQMVGERLEEGWQRAAEGLGTLGAAKGDIGQSCTSPTCWKEKIQQLEFSHLVRTTIAREGPDYRFKIELIRGESGEVSATTGGYCEICGVAELGDSIADEAANLAARLLEARDERAYLVVDGSPRGAEVWLDGTRVGTLPLELEIQPGSHGIEIRHEDHGTQIREWTATQGVRENMRFELTRDLGIVRNPRWGWLMAGSGLALTGVGIGLAALDERPHRPSCDGLRDDDDLCPRRYQTMATGMALLGTGLVALGTGVGLLSYYYHRVARTQRRHKQTQLGVSPRSIWFKAEF